MVILDNQSDTLVFKPPHGVVMIELPEEPLHQVVSSRIDLIQALHFFEAIGQIAAPASGNRYFL